MEPELAPEDETTWAAFADLAWNLAICSMVIAAVFMATASAVKKTADAVEASQSAVKKTAAATSQSAKKADVIEAGNSTKDTPATMVHVLLKPNGTITTADEGVLEPSLIKGRALILHAPAREDAAAIERAVASLYAAGSGPVGFTTRAIHAQ